MFGRRRPSGDSTYRRSQAVTTLPFRPGAVARGLSLRLLQVSDDAADRQRLGQMLITELNLAARLPACELAVPDRAQVHAHDGRRLRSKTYGYYRCWFDDRGSLSRARIRIYHRTAVRQQAISPKVFLNTLLHEWVHHHDFAGLRLARSPHTAGFYSRLRWLAEGLDAGFVLPPETETAAATG